ncbi:dCTP deaminase [Halostagnicola sp. A-GB9-2]|uniref:dCTP deaminase n=1 Tax=Halostagnicola sp. A-GB9-2 TaxID=3048066 RepID=UPI0024C0B59E|nr:dCTP deaminase [Halostagnicola sp. A-GB9-2]MDJ1430505.1 dCTP deaminase [Halostagnicola sp. A-GB9-2]
MSEEHPLATHVDNLVYEPTQVHDQGIDLTVSAIYTVDAPGKLDFGGDELEDAEFEAVPTAQQAPNDDYGWWELDGGRYVLQHNEFLTDVEDQLVLQARNELLARGCSHPTVWVSSHLPLLPLSVPEGGVQIKENARVSTLLSPNASDAMAERTLDDRSPDG